MSRSKTIAVFLNENDADMQLLEKLLLQLEGCGFEEKLKKKPLLLTDVPWTTLATKRMLFEASKQIEANRYYDLPMAALYVFSRRTLVLAGGFEEHSNWNRKNVILWDAYLRCSIPREILSDFKRLAREKPAASEGASGPSCPLPDLSDAFYALMRRLIRYPIHISDLLPKLMRDYHKFDLLLKTAAHQSTSSHPRPGPSFLLRKLGYSLLNATHITFLMRPEPKKKKARKKGRPLFL
jgi:hypothetical protein